MERIYVLVIDVHIYDWKRCAAHLGGHVGIAPVKDRVRHKKRDQKQYKGDAQLYCSSFEITAVHIGKRIIFRLLLYALHSS